MGVSAAQIKELREISGAGVMECKKALEEAGGDFAKAQEVLRHLAALAATKKAARATANGRVHSYVHGPGRIGVLLELRCESDFVAGNDEFVELAKELSMQVAAMNPIAVSRDQLPAETLEFHKERFRQEIADKPPQIQEKILEGKLRSFYQEAVLLEQPFIKDTKTTVAKHIESKIGVLKENITVGRFVRWELGGSN
jgi:elongation factor Ts